MKNIRKLLITLFLITFAFQGFAKDVPATFADLAERLMPSVVNISTTTTVITNTNPFPGFEFPPGSPFEDMFKEFGTPQKRKSAALGSGFIIDKKGILNVGGDKKTVYKFVKKYNKNIKKISAKKLYGNNYPLKQSMNINAYKKLIK